MTSDTMDATDQAGPAGQHPRSRWRVVRPLLVVVCLAAMGGSIYLYILLNTRPPLNTMHLQRFPLVVPAWVAFGLAIWLLRGVTWKKLAIGLIVGGGIALQVLAVTTPPSSSSDLYRYVWDGRVQAAGIDPYVYQPDAAALVPLRNDFLWAPYTTHQPPVVNTASVTHYCVTSSRRHHTVTGCTKINRPGDPTLYPPVAEGYFTLVHYAAPADDSTHPIQIAGGLCALLTTLVLLFGLSRMGRDPRLAALWAWCPLVILEGGNNAHVDILAALISSIAIVVLTRVRTEGQAMLGGALIGLAMAAKMTPAFLLPGVLRRGWQHILLAAATAFGVSYAPHMLAAGQKIIGYFPGYLKEQGYDSGNGYNIIGLVAPGKWATVVAFLLLALVALAIIRYCDPDQPWRGGLYMTAAALAVFTPEYQWYSLFLVLLVAFDGRWEWLAMAFGAYLANDSQLTATFQLTHQRLIGYGGGLLIAASVSLIRYRRSRRIPAGPQGDAAQGAEPGIGLVTAEAVSLPAAYTGGVG